jgi:hypothetical protein
MAQQNSGTLPGWQKCLRRSIGIACVSIAVTTPAFGAWEPSKPVEFVVPAGTGGGADQMARLLQGVITKNNLMKQPLIVVNKSGGAGARVSSRSRRPRAIPTRSSSPCPTCSPRRWRRAFRSTGKT